MYVTYTFTKRTSAGRFNRRETICRLLKTRYTRITIVLSRGRRTPVKRVLFFLHFSNTGIKSEKLSPSETLFVDKKYLKIRTDPSTLADNTWAHGPFFSTTRIEFKLSPVGRARPPELGENFYLRRHVLPPRNFRRPSPRVSHRGVGLSANTECTRTTAASTVHTPHVPRRGVLGHVPSVLRHRYLDRGKPRFTLERRNQHKPSDPGPGSNTSVSRRPSSKTNLPLFSPDLGFDETLVKSVRSPFECSCLLDHQFDYKGFNIDV